MAWVVVKWIKEDRVSTISRAWVVDPNPLPGSNKLKEDVHEGSFEHYTGDFRLVNKTVYCKPS